MAIGSSHVAQHFYLQFALHCPRIANNKYNQSTTSLSTDSPLEHDKLILRPSIARCPSRTDAQREHLLMR
jgi:hypothetical protein